MNLIKLSHDLRRITFLELSEHLICVDILKYFLHSERSFHMFVESAIPFLSKGIQIGKSFKHENGFVKIFLKKLAYDCKLRLHIYPAEEFIDSRIHAHRWNLSSFVILGELEGICYKESISEAGVRSCAFTLSDEVDGLKTSEPHRDIWLEEFAYYAISKNGSHYLDAATLHQVKKPAGCLSATLVITGPDRSKTSVVLGGSNFIMKRREFLELSEVVFLLRGILEQ